MTITVTRQVTHALIVCGWCGLLLREEEWDWTGEAEVTSHGICIDCLERFDREAEIAMGGYKREENREWD